MNDTREYIIDQAYGLFLSRSYEAVSISEISKAIGFTKGALYHHFTNKEDLFKAVIDKYLPLNDFFIPFNGNSLRDYIEECIKTSEKVVNSIVNSNNNFVPLNHMALLIDAFRHYPKYAKDKEKLIVDDIKSIEQIIQNAIDKKEIRSDINVKSMAMNFTSINTGVAASLMINKSPQEALKSLRNQFYELYNILKL